MWCFSPLTAPESWGSFFSLLPFTTLKLCTLAWLVSSFGSCLSSGYGCVSTSSSLCCFWLIDAAHAKRVSYKLGATHVHWSWQINVHMPHLFTSSIIWPPQTQHDWSSSSSKIASAPVVLIPSGSVCEGEDFGRINLSQDSRVKPFSSCFCLEWVVAWPFTNSSS